MSELSNKLREKRKKSGLKVSEVISKLKARGIDISDKTLYNWETGFRTPDADEFICLCEIYDVQSFSEFDEKEKSPAPEGAEDHISMDESNRLFDILISRGFIDEGVDLTDDDRAFLSHIIGLLDVWGRSKRK